MRARVGAVLIGSARRLHARWKAEPLVRNSAYLMLTTVVNGAVGYVYWIVAARLGTTTEVGVATAAIAILFLTSMATNLGIGPALIQALPRVGHDDRRWSSMVNASIVVAFAAGVVGSAIVATTLPMVLPRFDAVLRSPFPFAMFVLGAGLFSATLIADCVFVSERRGARMLVRNIVFALGKLALIVVPVLLGMRLSASVIVTSFVLGTVMSLGVALVQLHGLGRTYRRTLAGGAEAWRALRGNLAAHHLTWLGANLPQYVLPPIVVARLTASDNAFFSMAWTVGGVFFTVSPAAAAALFVEGASSQDRLGRSTRKSAVLITGLLGPAMLVFLLFGSQIMRLFGAEYSRPTQTLLRILVVSAIPDGVTNLYTSVLRVRRRIRTAAALNLFMAVVALGGAWILLPRLGVSGAGWAWITAQTLGALVVGVLVLRDRRATPVQVVVQAVEPAPLAMASMSSA